MHPWRQHESWGGRHTWSMGHPWRRDDAEEAALGRAALWVLMVMLGVVGLMVGLLWRLRRFAVLVVLLLVLAGQVSLVAFGLHHHYIYPAHGG